MHNSGIQLVLNIDPSKTTPEEAHEWALVWAAKVNTGVASATAGATEIFGLDKQLGRLTVRRPVFAPRVFKVHQTLVGLGYKPILPKSEKEAGELPPYVAYHSPDSGLNFGNLNSQTFHVMRHDLRNELAALPTFGANKRYAWCRLVSEDAVDALLKIAEREVKK